VTDSTTAVHPVAEALEPESAPAPPRGRRVHASVYADIRGPNLVKPTVDALLAPGEWVPEYLLVQIAGRKVHFNRAAKAYTAMRKAHHKKTPGVTTEQAGNLASEEYRADPDRADTIGRRRVVVNDTLRPNKKRYESRIIASGRYEGQREWRLRAGARSEPERAAPPAEPVVTGQPGKPRRSRVGQTHRPPGRAVEPADLPALLDAYYGVEPGQQRGYRGVDRVAAEQGLRMVGAGGARQAVLDAVPPERRLPRGSQANAPGRPSPPGSAPPPGTALALGPCVCCCPCPACRRVSSPHGPEEGAAPGAGGGHGDPRRRSEAPDEQGPGPHPGR